MNYVEFHRSFRAKDVLPEPWVQVEILLQLTDHTRRKIQGEWDPWWGAWFDSEGRIIVDRIWRWRPIQEGQVAA